MTDKLITDAELAEWEALCEKATGANWEYQDDTAWLCAEDPGDGEVYTIANFVHAAEQRCFGASRNGRFIAAARSAMPRLIEALRERMEHEREIASYHGEGRAARSVKNTDSSVDEPGSCR